MLTKKDKKKQEAASVIIELNTRNKKKFVTIVRGLELFGVDAPAAAKVFGKKVLAMLTVLTTLTVLTKVFGKNVQGLQ